MEIHVNINQKLEIECENELYYSIFNNYYYDRGMSKGQFQVTFK